MKLAPRRRSGFSVLELLLAILVFGTIAALALVKFADVKKKAYIDAMMNDLRNYALSEEVYLHDHAGYADTTQMRQAVKFAFSHNVYPDSQSMNWDVGAKSWYLRVAHQKTDVKCWLAMTIGQDVAGAAARIRCSGEIAAPAVQTTVADFGIAKQGTPPPLSASPDTVSFSFADTLLFDGEVSTVPSGRSIASYAWNFGDGATDTGPQVTHSYASAATGSVVATLTITDDQGATKTASKVIVLNNQPPTPKITIGLDSTTTSGRIAAVASRAMAQASAHAGRVTAHARATATVSAQQVAGRWIDSVSTANTLMLDGSQSVDPDGAVARFWWDTGDWQTFDGAVIHRRFSAEGTYPVRLYVQDNRGATAYRDTVLTVRPPLGTVTAQFSYTPTSPTTGTSIAFADSGSQATLGIRYFLWDFGDWTNMPTGPQVGHAYKTAGTYSVKLTVVDNFGHAGSITKTVTVSATAGVVANGLAHFWDPCQSYGKQTLTDIQGGLTAMLGSSTSTDAADPVWAYAPQLRGGVSAPPMLQTDPPNPTTQYLSVVNPSSDTTANKTIMVQVAAWGFNGTQSKYFYQGGSYTAYLNSNGTIGLGAGGMAAATPSEPGIPSLTDGALHTVAVVYATADSSVRVYVDGTAYGVLTGYHPSTAQSTFGSNLYFGSNSYEWQGYMGPILVYSRALTAAEIQANIGVLATRKCLGGPTAESLSIAPDPVTMTTKDTVRLTATPKDASGSPVTDRTVGWASLDTTIVTVTQAGQVIAHTKGQTWVRASTETASDSVQVTVTTTAIPGAGLIAQWSPCRGYGSQTLADLTGQYDAVLGTNTSVESADPDWMASYATPSRTIAHPWLLATTANSAQQYVTLPASLVLPPTAPAMSVVTELVTSRTNGGRLWYFAGSGAYAFINANTGAIGITAPSKTGVSTGATYPWDGESHTVGFVFDPAAQVIRTYVDGVQQGTTVPYTTFAQIGGSGSSLGAAAGEWVGGMGTTLLYNRVLTATEMQSADAGIRGFQCAQSSPASLVVSPDPVTVQRGGTAQLTALAKDDTGAVLPNRHIDWWTRNPAIATVDSLGVVTGVSTGSTYVIGAADWAMDSALVIVADTATVISGLQHRWSPCAAYGGQVLKDVVGGLNGQLGSTSSADANDPTWQSSIATTTGTLRVPMLEAQANSPYQYVALPGLWTEASSGTWVVQASIAKTPTTTSYVFNANTYFGLAVTTTGAISVERLQGTTSTWTAATGAGAFPFDGQLHVLGVTFDAARDSALVYLDGARVGGVDYTGAGTINRNSSDFLSDQSYEFQGRIGEALYYDRALTAAEMAQDAASLLRAQCDNPPTGADALTVAPDSTTIATGTNLQLTATITASGSPVFGAAVTWRTRNPAVATVDGTGLVHGVAKGQAWISATYNALTDSALVVVADTALAQNGLQHHWSPCYSTYGGQTVADLLGGTDAILGSTTSVESTDPVWQRDVNGAPVILQNTAGGLQDLTLPTSFVSNSASHTLVMLVSQPAWATSSWLWYSNGFGGYLTSAGAVGVQINSTSTQVTGNGAFPTGGLHTIAWVLDAVKDSALVYVDGTRQGAISYTKIAGMSGGYLGGTNAYDLGGYFGETYYYNRALSATEIATTATALKASPCRTDRNGGLSLANITITPNPIALVAGQVQQFVATMRDSAGQPVLAPTFTWSTSDPSVATVDASGRLTTIKKGQVNVLASASGVTGSAAVTVSQPAYHVVITTTNLTIPYYSDATQRLGHAQAVLYDSLGNVVPNANIGWYTSDYNIVYASAPQAFPTYSTITLAGYNYGSVKLTAFYRWASGDAGITMDTTTVTVAPPPTTDTTKTTRNLTMWVGDTKVISEDVNTDWGIDPYYPVQWSSNMPEVASTGTPFTVYKSSNRGGILPSQVQLMAWNPGTGWVVGKTATSTDSINVTVLARKAPLVTFKAVPDTVAVGAPVQFDPSASVSYNGGFVATSWSVRAVSGGAVVLGTAAAAPDFAIDMNAAIPRMPWTYTKGFQASGTYHVTLQLAESCQSGTTPCADTAGRDIVVVDSGAPVNYPPTLRVTASGPGFPLGYMDTPPTQDPCTTKGYVLIASYDPDWHWENGDPSTGTILEDFLQGAVVSTPSAGAQTSKVSGYNQVLETVGGQQILTGQTDRFLFDFGTYGTHTVTFTTHDWYGGHTTTTSVQITVPAPGCGGGGTSNQPPVASFTFSPSSPTTSQTVTFDGSSSYDPDGTVKTYTWDFGDWTQGSGVKPTHAWMGSGSYTVSLTVTDDKGATGKLLKTATVSGTTSTTGPTAAFTFSPNNAPAGTAVVFNGNSSTASSGATIQRYEWDFGDGAKGLGAQPSHTYASGGSFATKLTVTDSKGAVAVTTHTVSVTAAAARVDLKWYEWTSPMAAGDPGNTYGPYGQADADGTLLSFCSAVNPTPGYAFVPTVYDANGAPMNVFVAYSITKTDPNFVWAAPPVGMPDFGVNSVKFGLPLMSFGEQGTVTITAWVNYGSMGNTFGGVPSGYSGPTASITMHIGGC